MPWKSFALVGLLRKVEKHEWTRADLSTTTGRGQWSWGAGATSLRPWSICTHQFPPCMKIKFELARRTHTDYCGHWLVRTCNAWLHTLMHEYKMRCTTQAVFAKSTWESPASQLVSCRVLACVYIPYHRPLLNPWRNASWCSLSWRFSCRRPTRCATPTTSKRRRASPGRYLDLSNNSFWSVRYPRVWHYSRASPLSIVH